ncbi:MAG: hypothetical protein DRQ44_15695 [Gammaproteobacteria bacterium]|nr:MAG: hypothetical protein DRQ44_15695 [Gammaproteobacteria bacterium]
MNMKIKTNVAYLIASLVLCLGLTACKTNSSIPQQITSLNINCPTQEVEISNETDALNGEQTWTAKCGGKTYFCNYFPESGSNCYEITE